MMTAVLTFTPQQLRAVLSIPICVTGRVPAGDPLINEEGTEMVDLNEQLISHPDDTYGLTVFGNSMDEHEIHSGDLILVDRVLEPKPSSIVVVDVDGALTVKRFSRCGERLFLVSGNGDCRQISHHQRCENWGVVTYVIHKF